MSGRDAEPLRWPLVLIGLLLLAALVYVIALEPLIEMRRGGSLAPAPAETASVQLPDGARR